MIPPTSHAPTSCFICPSAGNLPFPFYTSYRRYSFYTVKNTPEIFPFGQKCLLYQSYHSSFSIPPGRGLRREVRHPGATGKVMRCFGEILRHGRKNHLENLAFRPLTMPRNAQINLLRMASERRIQDREIKIKTDFRYAYKKNDSRTRQEMWHQPLPQFPPNRLYKGHEETLLRQ